MRHPVPHHPCHQEYIHGTWLSISISEPCGSPRNPRLSALAKLSTRKESYVPYLFHLAACVLWGVLNRVTGITWLSALPAAGRRPTPVVEVHHTLGFSGEVGHDKARLRRTVPVPIPPFYTPPEVFSPGAGRGLVPLSKSSLQLLFLVQCHHLPHR